MSKAITFFSKQHKEEFKELLEQAHLESAFSSSTSQLEHKQIAFLYLIACYQEEYKRYEGCKFYVEDLGELSLEGPLYLLEEKYITLKQYDHEIMLGLAKKILEGTLLETEYEGCSPKLLELLKVALRLSKGDWTNYLL